MPQATNKTFTLLQSLDSHPRRLLDSVPGATVIEKMIELELTGVPSGSQNIFSQLNPLVSSVRNTATHELKVVVFGGGTGLSTVVGGDSCTQDWPSQPFQGLKEVFPKTTSIVCVTDDGGSTGELLKYLPIIGLGDLRHVLLSSIRQDLLKKLYDLEEVEIQSLVEALARLFNFRFNQKTTSFTELFHLTELSPQSFPQTLFEAFEKIGGLFYTDPRFKKALSVPQCLGNLFMAAFIFSGSDPGLVPSSEAAVKGINRLAELIGVEENSVLPCCVTPSQLKILYSNGVLITGESKSASARRGYPVEKSFVDYVGQPQIPRIVLEAVAAADIFVFAPGSLYTSIIPVLQVPGLADAVRANKKSLKVLVANIWAQKGETDISREDPSRRYQVADLLKAFHFNVPGGLANLFQVVMLLGLQDIPGSIIQRYAVEGKTPIYCDRTMIEDMGLVAVESKIFAQQALRRGTVKHDPDAFARALRTVWACRKLCNISEKYSRVGSQNSDPQIKVRCQEVLPCKRFQEITLRLAQIGMKEDLFTEIFWRHKDIPFYHINNVAGLHLIEKKDWKRCQEWDNVFSYYDPQDRKIYVRSDLLIEPEHFEVAFLVALGQSLLGNYIKKKTLEVLHNEEEEVGGLFRLSLRKESETNCLFNRKDLELYLLLARMNQSRLHEDLFFRVLNGREGFTPPGMLFGLVYAWYLDNNFASHIEYKMGISRMPITNLVPEQIKSLARRQELIAFFRRVVFGRWSGDENWPNK